VIDCPSLADLIMPRSPPVSCLNPAASALSSCIAVSDSDLRPVNSLAEVMEDMLKHEVLASRLVVDSAGAISNEAEVDSRCVARELRGLILRGREDVAALSYYMEEGIVVRRREQVVVGAVLVFLRVLTNMTWTVTSDEAVCSRRLVCRCRQEVEEGYHCPWMIRASTCSVVGMLDGYTNLRIPADRDMYGRGKQMTELCQLGQCNSSHEASLTCIDSISRAA